MFGRMMLMTVRNVNVPTQNAASNSPGQYTASWGDVAWETSYTLYYSTSSSLTGTTYNGSTAYPESPNATAGKITGIAAGVTAYTINGLTGGVTYYTRISAVNGSGEESALSKVQSAAAAAPVENGSAGWVKSEGGTGAATMTLAYSGGEDVGDERKSRTKTLDLAPGTITIEGTAWAYDEDGATYGGVILYVDDVQVAGGDEMTPVVYESAYSGSHVVKIECYAGRDFGGPSPSPSSSVTSVSIPVAP